jgi:hypothetical protein
MIVFGVVRVFFAKTSKITTASTRLRQANRLPLLQQTQQITGLDPGRTGEGRRPDFSVKPDERLVARAHGDYTMSDPTCSQMVASI